MERTGSEPPPALDQLALPRRGKALKELIVLRIIAVDRAIHSIAFGMLAVALTFLDLHLFSLQNQARAALRPLEDALAPTGQAQSRTGLSSLLHKVLGLRPGTLKVLIATAAAYCALEGIEAVGLWRAKRWAEYLTAIATAGFLPFEVDELLKRVTALRVFALVVNVIVLVYLVWAKRLFGLRGGAEAEAALDPLVLFAPGSIGEPLRERL